MNVRYVEFRYKTGKAFRLPIESFQYFDFTIAETKYKLSYKETKVYDTLMCNFLHALLDRNPKVVNDYFEIEENLSFIDYTIEYQNINTIMLYDEYHQPIYELKMIHCWNDQKKNDFQKNYFFKGCLGINIKRNNDKL